MKKIIRVESIEETLNKYSGRMEELFSELGPEITDLQSIKRTWNNGSKLEACRKLLNYYENNYDLSWIDFETQWKSWDHEKELPDIQKGIFTFQNIRAKIPHEKDGHLNWEFLGPHKDKEFGYFLNRQHYLRILSDEYEKTGEEKYAKLFDKLMQDWLTANPPPGRRQYSVIWRALEACLRIMWVWTRCFFSFLKSENFTPATRLLMLAAIPGHAKYIKKYCVNSGNIRVMELNSLTTIGAVWPQFKSSKEWVEHGIKNLLPELSGKQVYPDGVQKELTNHYHMVAMKNFEHAMKMAEKSGVKIPEGYKEGVEKMWNYYAWTTRPDGYGLLNNDADRDDHTQDLLKAAERFNREEWKYIATNGKEGISPNTTSFVSSWAGHLISRDAFKTDAQWGFFDFGPLGTGHVHRDKLHISLSCHEDDLLVDSGRYRYINDKWRKKYFRSTQAHNSVLIDYKGQSNYERERKDQIHSNQSITTADYDFAIGYFDNGYKRNVLKRIFNKAVHVRAYTHVKGRFWIVLDKVSFKQGFLGKNRSTIQVLWHFHPAYDPQIENQSLYTKHSKRCNLTILPIINEQQWKVKTVRGQELPYIQGWWSEEYNLKVPATCAEYHTMALKDNIFAWILVPWKEHPPKVQQAKLSVKGKRKTNLKIEAKINGKPFSAHYILDYEKLKRGEAKEHYILKE